jgi:hypothetical protein
MPTRTTPSWFSQNDGTDLPDEVRDHVSQCLVINVVYRRWGEYKILLPTLLCFISCSIHAAIEEPYQRPHSKRLQHFPRIQIPNLCTFCITVKHEFTDQLPCARTILDAPARMSGSQSQTLDARVAD